MNTRAVSLCLCLLLATSAYGAVIKGKVTAPVPKKKSDVSGGYTRGVFTPGSSHAEAREKQTAEKAAKIVIWAVPEGVVAPFSKPAKKPELIQENKEFKPAILVVQTGTTVAFPNLDPLYHNVFSYSKAKRFDLGRYQQGKSKEVTFAEPGVVEVFCEIHENMHAYIVVVDTPYFTVTDNSGDYSLEVPAGKYQVLAWIPNTKSEPVPVDLSSSKDLEVNFSF